jgi:hypothetical protein
MLKHKVRAKKSAFLDKKCEISETGQRRIRSRVGTVLGEKAKTTKLLVLSL